MRKLRLLIIVLGFFLSNCEKVETVNENDKQIVTADTSNWSLLSLKDVGLTCVTIDNNDKPWFGTDGKIIKYSDSILIEKRLPLSTAKVTCIHFDSSDIIWVGTLHDGVYKYESNRWTHFDLNENVNYWITDIKTENDKTWISTIFGVFQIKNGFVTKFSNQDIAVYDIYVKDSLKYFSTSNGILKYDNLKWTIINQYNNVAISSDNWPVDTTNVYVRNNIINKVNSNNSSLVVSSLHGISIFDDISWENYYTKDLFDQWYFQYLVVDENNITWIQCLDGLLKYDGEFEFIKSAIKLEANYSQNMAIDKNGEIWLINQYGILSYKTN